ncbi:hypothetical protein [Paenibacillus sp. An7]|uniref:hypothetical protein n=1 Tax=Paenibacillus sp. An7 TaxID=2689577 RepID=UPI00135CDA72|nr:hypothetical protein [Paenibacillus sp. An7]
MPSSPRTSTLGLTNATLPYALRLADRGVLEVLKLDPALRAGLHVFQGQVIYEAVARDLGYEYTPVDKAITNASST